MHTTLLISYAIFSSKNGHHAVVPMYLISINIVKLSFSVCDTSYCEGLLLSFDGVLVFPVPCTASTVIL